MNVTRVTTERIAPGSAHGLVAAANIEGEDLTPRAAPLVVRFGNVKAVRVVPMISEQGVRAIFRQMPPVGAQLAIGYVDEPPTMTRFEWVDPPGEPVA